MANQVECLPLPIPPDKLIVELVTYIGKSPVQSVLDIGCGEGRHSRHVAQAGHFVVGLDQSPAELSQASAIQQFTEKLSGRIAFVQGSALAPPFVEPFDIVMCNHVLHLLSKPDAVKVLDSARSLTKPYGLNAVSGYLVQAGEANRLNNARCFHPGELERAYKEVGWQILYYSETYAPIQHWKDKEFINSKARLLARKLPSSKSKAI